MPLGGILSLLILAPNLAWLVLSSRDAEPAQDHSALPLNRLLPVLEQIGRIGVFTTPFFYDFVLRGGVEKAALFALLIALIIYYACWWRYFGGGRRFGLLYEPLWSVPVPMAVAPVAAFCMGAIVLHSTPLAVASAVLGVSHIPLSLHKAKLLASAHSGEHVRQSAG